MALKKSEIARPALPKETIDIPELGGEVIVQAMMMSERLQVATSDLPKFAHIAEVLSRSVVDADGVRINTAEEWEVFGGQNQEAVWKLFQVAQKLSKLGAPDEKKPEIPS